MPRSPSPVEQVMPTTDQPCQCHNTGAHTTPTHPGHCCWAVDQTCHQDEVDAWRARYRAGRQPA